jgi:hypothetical protein
VTAAGKTWKFALAGLVFAALMVLAPWASASGSGYSLNFTSSSNAADANVNLVSLSTSPTGSQVTVTAQVSGQIIDNNANYIYDFFFGGTLESNASAYILLTNNTTYADYYSTYGGGFAFGTLPFTLGNGGSSITVAINQSAVGPSSGFSANAEAVYGTESSGSVSLLGSAYPNGGESGSCTQSVCTTTTAASNALSTLEYAGIGILIVLVVVVILVVVLVMRKKKTPPAAPMMGQPQYYPSGMPPAPPAGTAPPPPPPPA